MDYGDRFTIIVKRDKHEGAGDFSEVSSLGGGAGGETFWDRVVEDDVMWDLLCGIR